VMASGLKRLGKSFKKPEPETLADSGSTTVMPAAQLAPVLTSDFFATAVRPATPSGGIGASGCSHWQCRLGRVNMVLRFMDSIRLPMIQSFGSKLPSQILIRFKFGKKTPGAIRMVYSNQSK
jgi:hypothetical protein